MTRQLEENIREWVARGSAMAPGLVLKGHQDAPAPNELYAVVTHMSTRATGLPLAQDDETVLVEMVGAYDVQWFREGAVVAGQRLVAWSHSQLGGDLALGYGFRLVAMPALRDLSSVLALEWEERSGVDLMVSWNGYVDDRIRTFEARDDQAVAGVSVGKEHDLTIRV